MLTTQGPARFVSNMYSYSRNDRLMFERTSRRLIMMFFNFTPG